MQRKNSGKFETTLLDAIKTYDLGQSMPIDEPPTEGEITEEELEWAYEQGAEDEQDAITLINLDKREGGEL